MMQALCNWLIPDRWIRRRLSDAEHRGWNRAVSAMHYCEIHKTIHLTACYCYKITLLPTRGDLMQRLFDMCVKWGQVVPPEVKQAVRELLDHDMREAVRRTQEELRHARTAP